MGTGKDKRKRTTTGYYNRWIKVRFEKYKQKVKEFMGDLNEFLSTKKLKDEFIKFVKAKRRERNKKQKEIINNDGKETEKDSEVCSN